MADITANLVQVYTDGRCSRVALYALNKANALDTFDVGAAFRVVKRAGLISQTGNHIAAITTMSGTVLTVPAGPSDDGVWLFVVGVAN